MRDAIAAGIFNDLVSPKAFYWYLATENAILLQLPPKYYHAISSCIKTLHQTKIFPRGAVCCHVMLVICIHVLFLEKVVLLPPV